MEPSPGLARIVRRAGLVVWAMVGVPVLVHGGLDPRRVAAWAVVYLAFAAALVVETRAPRRTALLLVQAVCVVAMVLLLCDGFEGALLVLVAMRVGERTTLRAGLVWVFVQTLLLAAAIAVHWTPNASLLLTPPYLGFQILALLTARAVTREAAARQELARTNRELLIAKELVAENARLAERLRISRDLHDLVGHRLTALGMSLQAAEKLAEGHAKEPTVVARGLAKQLLADVRGVVAELRDDAGERVDLATALRALADDMPSVRVHVTMPDAFERQEGRRAITLLRCAQEIVTNAARHAGAANVWIDLAVREGGIELCGRDDGIGARVLTFGDGLSGMRERIESLGGHLDVKTSPGDGFTVRAIFPREAEAPS